MLNGWGRGKYTWKEGWVALDATGFYYTKEQYNFSSFSFHGQIGNSQNTRPRPIQDLLFIYSEHPVSCPNAAAQVLQGNSWPFSPLPPHRQVSHSCTLQPFYLSYLNRTMRISCLSSLPSEHSQLDRKEAIWNEREQVSSIFSWVIIFQGQRLGGKISSRNGNP